MYSECFKRNTAPTVASDNPRSGPANAGTMNKLREHLEEWWFICDVYWGGWHRSFDVRLEGGHSDTIEDWEIREAR